MDKTKAMPETLSLAIEMKPLLLELCDIIPTYSLFGLIICYGKNSKKCHYTSIVKKGDDWIEFTKESANKVDLEYVLRKRVAQIAFYR